MRPVRVGGILVQTQTATAQHPTGWQQTKGKLSSAAQEQHLLTPGVLLPHTAHETEGKD